MCVCLCEWVRLCEYLCVLSDLDLEEGGARASAEAATSLTVTTRDGLREDPREEPAEVTRAGPLVDPAELARTDPVVDRAEAVATLGPRADPQGEPSEKSPAIPVNDTRELRSVSWLESF